MLVPLAATSPAFAGDGAAAPIAASLDPVARLYGAGGPGADGEPGDYFGSALATDGTSYLIGTPGDDLGTGAGAGSVHVHTRSAAGWALAAKLAAPGPVRPQSFFGAAVAVDGDLAVVGAPGTYNPESGLSRGAIPGQGAAYVFRRQSGEWQLAATLVVASSAPGARLGASVAVRAGRIAIGAPGDAVEGRAEQGVVYLFDPDPPGWTLAATVVAADGAARDEFGSSVGFTSQELVVGARRDDVAGVSDAGSLRILRASGTSWSEVAVLTALVPVTSGCFADAIALSGDRLLVGAPGSTTCNSGGPTPGRAMLFERAASEWTRVDEWSMPSGTTEDAFGSAVALWGDRAAIGASGRSLPSLPGVGAAFVYVRSSPGWVQEAILEAPTATAYADLGAAVALVDDAALVGAPRDDLGNRESQGSVRAFVRNAGAWEPDGRIDAGVGASFSMFGSELAIDGETLVVGAPGASRVGSARVFVRTGSDWTLQSALSAEVGIVNDGFGSAVAVDGDVAAIGAPGPEAPFSRPGAVQLFVRAAGAWTLLSELQAPDGRPGDKFGASLAMQGDTLVVGAPRAGSSSALGRGAAYVFVRNGSQWLFRSKLAGTPPSISGGFGRSVAMDGGLLAVSAYGGVVGDGIVQVFSRDGDAWVLRQQVVAEDAAALDDFGHALALRGDQLLVGAPGDDSPAWTDQGSAYLFRRAGGVWGAVAKLVPPATAEAASAGWSIALSGEVVVVGAFRAAVAGEGDVGEVYVFTPAADGQWTRDTVLAPGPIAARQFGLAVAVSGQTLVVGAPGGTRPLPWSNPGEGIVDVFEGLPPPLLADGFE